MTFMFVVVGLPVLALCLIAGAAEWFDDHVLGARERRDAFQRNHVSRRR